MSLKTQRTSDTTDNESENEEIEWWIHNNYNEKKAALLINGGACSSYAGGPTVIWNKPFFQTLTENMDPVDIDLKWICDLALKHRVKWVEMWLEFTFWQAGFRN